MGQNYGQSFAAKLIEQGHYDQAVTSASEAHARDRDDPEPLVDRAQAYVELDRHAEAVADFEAALVLDRDAGMLDLDLIDDAIFSSLLAEARAMPDVERAVERLGHYKIVLGKGRHLADVDTWTRRMRGEGRNDVIVKERS